MFNFGHPSADALERFLLHSVRGSELVQLEGHILACEPCIARLEEIELNLAATKLALRHLRFRASHFFLIVGLPSWVIAVACGCACSSLISILVDIS